MTKTKVLIVVKTYPTLSVKYDELVCTAGFREDGTWVRIYPIPFRKISYDQQYKKYDWIELDLVKNTSDFRPESYRPKNFETPISVIGHIDTANNWQARKTICLQKVYYNMQNLIDEAKNKNFHTSLAVFKPKQILDFVAIPTERVWDSHKIDLISASRTQLNLFEDLKNDFQYIRKVPYIFKFKFEDELGKISSLMIEDWETGQLFWNCLSRSNGNEKLAVEDVRKKYFEDFAKTKDLYFYLGTTKQFHFKSRNPFMIIGTFYPKKETQLNLF